MNEPLKPASGLKGKVRLTPSFLKDAGEWINVKDLRSAVEGLKKEIKDVLEYDKYTQECWEELWSTLQLKLDKWLKCWDDPASGASDKK